MPKKESGDQKVVRKSNEVVTREIQGKVVLMPLHKSSKDINCIYTLNETASYAWNLFDGKSTMNDVRKTISESYDVAEDKVEKELVELVKDLKSIKAIL
jgi:hypothetical protein